MAESLHTGFPLLTKLEEDYLALQKEVAELRAEKVAPKLSAVVADPDLFEEKTGIPVGSGKHAINPKYFNIVPKGNQILVAQIPVIDRYGDIILPDTSNERSGAGFIMGAGPVVGLDPGAPPPGGLYGVAGIYMPEDALYKHVIYSIHAGTPIKAEYLDRDYEGPVVMMTERDVLAVDLNPWSLPVVEE